MGRGGGSGRGRRGGRAFTTKKQTTKRDREAKKPEWKTDCPIPKKKYAISFGYLGNGYKGMAQQINPEDGTNKAKTIEGTLVDAFKVAGMIPQVFIGSLGRMQFSRVGRTDKGVHAAGQFIALRSDLGPCPMPIRLPKSVNKETKMEATAENTSEVDTPSPSSVEELDGVSLDPVNLAKVHPFTYGMVQSSEEDKMTAISYLSQRYPNAFSNRGSDFDPKDGFRQMLWSSGRELDTKMRLQKALEQSGGTFKVHSVCRVAGSFDSRHHASGRHYEYLLPSWLLCPVQTNDTTFPELKDAPYRKIVDRTSADVEKQHEENQPCPRERKNPRRMKSFLSPMSEEDLAEAQAMGRIRRIRKMQGTAPPVVPTLSTLIASPPEPSDAIHRPAWEGLELKARTNEGSDLPQVDLDSVGPWRRTVFGLDERMKYRLSDDDIQRFRGIVKKYEGMHAFHNFTSGLSASDPSAMRFMNDIEVDIHIDEDGEQLLTVKLHGQSFLLNQIRKMVGLAVEVFRGSAPSWAIEEAMSVDVKRFIPMAPAEGLLLDEPEYSAYNKHKAVPPTTPTLPGLKEDDVTNNVVNCLLPARLDDREEDDKEEGAMPDCGSLNAHVHHICDPSEEMRLSKETFKQNLVYSEVLRTVREASACLSPSTASEVDANQETDKVGGAWRMFILDLDWHPYGMENFPPGRINRPPTNQNPTPTEVCESQALEMDDENSCEQIR